MPDALWQWSGFWCGQVFLFAREASYCTGRVVDILSLKRRVPTFTLEYTDACHQAPELDDGVVEPRAAGKCTNNWWKLQQQLPGRWQAGQRWVDNFKSALVDKLGLSRCVGDGDAHGRCAWFWPRPTSGEKFKKDLAIHIRFRDGGVHHDGRSSLE